MESADAVLRALPDRAPGDLVLVGIDGPAGSGKSTLAKALAAGRPITTVVHCDDFYGPEEREWRRWTPEEGSREFFDHKRLESQVLEPLRRGRPGRFRPYDWPKRGFVDWVDVQPRGLVIVEGVYVLRRRLRAYWDLAVYVDTPRELRIPRLADRGEREAGWIAGWMAAEDWYLKHDRPEAAAGLVVRGW